MSRRMIALVGVLAVLGAACSSKTTGSAASPSPSPVTPSSESPATPSTGASAYTPVIDPANFLAVVDNPWFPLKPGSVYVYEGVKDGEAVRDVMTVTHGIQLINGVPCVVVKDQLFAPDGSLTEDTTDFYTQDLQGKVWYFGEVTASLDDQGNLTDTEGSWLAGQDGALPGIFMEANPTVGHSFRQEYYPGHAEDQFTVLDLAASVSTPFGSFTDTLLTEETTALEPTIVDHKNYEKGVGEVAELQVQGPQPPEELKLVSYRSE